MAITKAEETNDFVYVYSNEREIFKIKGKLLNWCNNSVYVKTEEGNILIGENGEKI